jgi:uncharacterized glyoxalase superfamily protein PhnB
MKPSKPIPDGVQTITPRFVVRDAPKAIAFYEKAFGAEVIERMFGPDGTTIWYARLRIGTSNVFLGEEGTGPGDRSPQSLGGSPMWVQMYVEDAASAFKRAVDAGCTVRKPIEETFWGELFGQVVDPFGFQWAIAQRLHDLSPEELKHAVSAAWRLKA